MSNSPIVKPGDWITVGAHKCIVQAVFPQGSECGICKVVYLHLNKPTTNHVSWDGEKWFISNPFNEFGGYAHESDPFIYELRQQGKAQSGRNRR